MRALNTVIKAPPSTPLLVEPTSTQIIFVAKQAVPLVAVTTTTIPPELALVQVA
ncbi:MAG: hypothetical protein AAFY30_14080 [Cyanobacteria bacterium J06642_12]